MSSISSIGSAAASMIYRTGNAGASKPQDPVETLDKVFSELDTGGKGYLDASDFKAAFDKLDESSDSTAVAGSDEVFSALDSDGDGKLTSSEMAESLKNLSDSLAYAGGMAAGMGGMPPPPPPLSGQDPGFTQEELTSQLADLTASDQTSEADSARADLISSVLGQFDTADADGDDRVTFEEAMALEQSGSQAATASAAAGSTATDTATAVTAAAGTNTDTQVMNRIMQLMQAYGASNQTDSSSDQVSLTA